MIIFVSEMSLNRISDTYTLVAYDSDSESSIEDTACNNVPYVPLNVKENEENDDCEPISITRSDLSHRLTNLVRQQYFSYLEKLLSFNYEISTSQKLNQSDLIKYAEFVEQKALRSCMIVNLYRESMLDIFNQIKTDTKERKLNQTFQDENIENVIKNKTEHIDVEIQTDNMDKRKRNVSTQTDVFYEPYLPEHSDEYTQSNYQQYEQYPYYDHNSYHRTHNYQQDYNIDNQYEYKNHDINHQYSIQPQQRSYTHGKQPIEELDSGLTLSLDARIKQFERKLKEEDRKRKQFYEYLAKRKREDKMKEKYEKKFKSNTDLLPNLIVEPVINAAPTCLNNTIQQNLPIVSVSTPIIPTMPTALLTPYSNTLISSQTDDNIAKELQALFGSDEEDDTDIFGEMVLNNEHSQNCDKVDNNIIINANVNYNNNSNPVMNNTNSNNYSHDNTNTYNHNINNINNNIHNNINNNNYSISLNTTVNNSVVSSEVTVDIDKHLFNVENQIRKPEIDLKDSLWPCELHMRKQKLHEVMLDVAEKGFRHTEAVRSRFISLFGEDDCDDFGPHSPSIDIDDVLMGSCKKRIAPWIVRCLMKPMNDGLIANRYLFKKLAKRIAEDVLTDNKYPDERRIKMAVTDYFCEHPFVNTIHDIL